MVLTHATVVPITELPLQITHVQSLVTGLNKFVQCHTVITQVNTKYVPTFYFDGDLNAG